MYTCIVALKIYLRKVTEENHTVGGQKKVDFFLRVFYSLVKVT